MGNRISLTKTRPKSAGAVCLRDTKMDQR
jgi:hypothetical protein